MTYTELFTRESDTSCLIFGDNGALIYMDSYGAQYEYQPVLLEKADNIQSTQWDVGSTFTASHGIRAASRLAKPNIMTFYFRLFDGSEESIDALHSFFSVNDNFTCEYSYDNQSFKSVSFVVNSFDTDFFDKYSTVTVTATSTFANSDAIKNILLTTITIPKGTALTPAQSFTVQNSYDGAATISVKAIRDDGGHWNKGRLIINKKNFDGTVLMGKVSVIHYPIAKEKDFNSFSNGYSTFIVDTYDGIIKGNLMEVFTAQYFNLPAADEAIITVSSEVLSYDSDVKLEVYLRSVMR